MNDWEQQVYLLIQRITAAVSVDEEEELIEELLDYIVEISNKDAF